MSFQDDLPTQSQRRPKKGRRRLSGAQEVDVSSSLDDFIGSACALLDQPEPEVKEESAPEPAAAAEPDLIAERVAQIEAALERAASRVAALAEPPPVRTRGRLGLSAASAAIGAFLGVIVLLVGYGRSQGERQVSAARPAVAAPATAPAARATPAAAPAAPPAPAAAPAEPLAPAAAPGVQPPAVAAPAAPAASAPKKPARRKAPARRPAAPASGGIVDPFAR